ncbi:MAG TPA: histidine phosphatase family protein [Kiloniellales bacterium]|nr:histidine phosphatase family protein [Kiloniellales bacterium]
MRQLLLYRHAKSAWDDPALDDLDRPLAPRGRRAAVRMARAMAQEGWLPQRAMVSPAERCRQTWALGFSPLPDVPQAILERELYLAPPARLLEIVRRTPEGVRSLLLLGHNPGLQSFALKLAGAGSEPEACRRLAEKFPTAAVAVLEFESEWQGLSWAAARLTHFLRPRDLD